MTKKIGFDAIKNGFALFSMNKISYICVILYKVNSHYQQ